MKKLSLVACVLLLGSIQFSYSQTLGQNQQEAADETLTGMLKDAEQLPKVTRAGRMVADRNLARSLIDFGLETKNPESILIGVEILNRNPVKSVKADPDVEIKTGKAELLDLIKQAAAMRRNDEVLDGLIERTTKKVEALSRGLAGGPKSWTVNIKKGSYYQLDPSLIYNAHEKAIVSAFADKNTVIGVSVRRQNQNKEQVRAVRKGEVTATWNAGIHTTGWDVRIYNLVGPGTKSVRIETN